MSRLPEWVDVEVLTFVDTGADRFAGLPEVDLARVSADARAAAATRAPVTEIVSELARIDRTGLSQSGRIDLALALERVKAWAEAAQAAVLVEAVREPDVFVPPPSGDADRDADRARRARLAGKQYVRDEAAVALRWAPVTTRSRIETARLLIEVLPATFALISAGDLSYLHGLILATEVRRLDPRLAARVEARVLDRASSQTPGEFRRSVRRAVAALDPRGEEQRHEDAAEQRFVSVRPEPGTGMAWLTGYLPAPDAETIMTAVQGIADTAPADDERSADQKRADALTALAAAALTGNAAGAGLPAMSSWQGRKPHVQVSVALSTLLGLDDQPGELDGHGPIPAALARRVAADPTGTWTRLVTDPLGRLLDYGRTRYKPPQDLADLITARDRTCGDVPPGGVTDLQPWSGQRVVLIMP
jgi:hypothetical protein